MVIPNIQALKTADNLKWDFQAGYQKALQVFNYSGEITEEYKTFVKEFLDSVNAIKADADFLLQEAGKFVQ